MLTTLKARYAHAAFGLRYLLANLGELRARAVIREYDISQKAVDVVEAILAERPRIVGIGVYIWNVSVATQVVAMMKRVAPEVIVVLGGPEVSHETDQQGRSSRRRIMWIAGEWGFGSLRNCAGSCLGVKRVREE